MKIIELIKKDLKQEVRGKESLVFIAALSLVLACVVALGINSAMINDSAATRLFPSLLWVIFIFTATLTISRSLDNELEHMALEGLLMLGISPCAIFLSKLFSTASIMAAGLILSAASLGILLNIPVLQYFTGLSVIGAFVVFAYSALATIAVGIASTSKVKSLMIPLILIPLLFPLFLAATELTAALYADGKVSFDSFWLSLLAALNVVYIVIGANLYEFVIKE